MKEAYVSFEVAKLLKEKGFDGECRMMYREHDKRRLYYVPDPNHIGEFTIDAKWIKSHTKKAHAEYLLAPTLQMACAWLREVYNILLFLLPAQENGKLVYLVEVWTWNEEEGIYESTYAPMPRKEPEQAVEAAIKYTLENLI